MALTRIVGVYNANGGLVGELRYLVGHYFYGRSCSLCDITHSPLHRKKAWDEQVSALGIPFTLLHLNELDAATRDYVGDYAPLVFADLPHLRVRLISDADLTALDGDVDAFFVLLRERISELPGEDNSAVADQSSD
jgi:hypothetical protein